MNKFGLQLFGDTVSGKKIAYLYRLLKDAATSEATHVAFTTENGLNMSRDADVTETKDGPVRTPGAVETEITTAAILSVGDTMIDKLKNALISGEKVEVWRVNLAEPAEVEQNKFKATYYQAYVTEFEETSNAEDHVECSLSFGVEGTGVDGEATVTKLQQEMINLYGFADTTRKSE